MTVTTSEPIDATRAGGAPAAPMRLQNRRGVALVAALLGVVVITAMIIGGHFASTQEFRGARNLLVEQRAFAVAEYGLNHEISQWDRRRNLLPPATGAMAIGATDLKRRYVSGDDTAFVTLTRLSPTTFLAVSEGKAQMGNSALQSRRRTSAFVRLAYPSIDASAAITANGNIAVRGSSKVTGENTAPSGWTSCGPFTGPEVYAVRVPTTAVVDAKGGNFPGALDVLQDAGAGDPNLYLQYGSESYNSLVANADIRLPGGTVNSSIIPQGTATTCTTGNTNWGEPRRVAKGAEVIIPGCYDHFPIIHSATSLRINGNGRGQGILLVDGDLEIDGTFDFFGIVVVKNDVAHGTGTAAIHGAVFSRNADVGDGSTFAGTQDVFYSQCAVENALRGSAILTRVTQRHWTQLY